MLTYITSNLPVFPFPHCSPLPSPLPHSLPVRMASRNFSKALRPLARQLASPATQQRTFVAAAAAVRASAVASRVAAAPARQQVRGVKTIDFAGTKEDVYGKSFLRWWGGPIMDGVLVYVVCLIARFLTVCITERADWPQEKLLVSHHSIFFFFPSSIAPLLLPFPPFVSSGVVWSWAYKCVCDEGIG